VGIRYNRGSVCIEQNGYQVGIIPVGFVNLYRMAGGKIGFKAALRTTGKGDSN
jgi:hypothetical protein